MASNYYRSLFDNGYQSPKPPKTATVPAKRTYAAPTVAKNTIAQPATLKKDLQKPVNLTQAGNLYETEVNDVLSGVKKAPNVQSFQTKVNRVNAQRTTTAANSAQQRAAQAGIKPGTAAYERLLADGRATANSENLENQHQANEQANSVYSEFLDRGRALESDAYGKANAERSYGTERDDVLYGRGLNERDYSDSRDDKQNALDKEALDFNTTQDLNEFNMANSVDRQNRQDFETDRDFDMGAKLAEEKQGQQEVANDQFDRTFGASESQRNADNAFRGMEFDEDKYRYSTDRGDRISRDSVEDDQWQQVFGAGREDRASDDFFRDSQADDDRERFDLTRSDDREDKSLNQSNIDREFGASRQDRASDDQFRDSQADDDRDRFDLTRSDEKSENDRDADQWEREFGSSESQRATDNAFRDSESADDRERFDLNRADDRSDRASDDSFRDSEFSENTRRYDTDRLDTLNENDREADQWERTFGADEDQRATDNQFRDSEAAEETRRYDTDRGDTLSRNAIEDGRYDTEYADSRKDLDYDRSDAAFNDLIDSLDSEAAKQALVRAKNSGVDAKTAYNEMFEADGQLKEGFRDISPEQAKKLSRIEELSQIYPEKSPEEIENIVSSDMLADYEAERAGVVSEQDKANQVKRLKSVASPQDFAALPSSDLSALANDPQLTNKYKDAGYIRSADPAVLKGMLRDGDAVAKGITKGAVVQMADGSLVKILSVNSKKTDGMLTDFRQMTVRGTDAKTGKEVLVYDSGKVQI